MHPDTLELEAEDEAQVEAQAQAQVGAQVQADNTMSFEELKAQLFETVSQASLEERAQQIAACQEIKIELDVPVDKDKDEVVKQHASILPPVKYDLRGHLTSHSKGKGWAN